MKNLRTIVTLLVLTVMTFSCQTNDELVELETLNEVDKSFNRGEVNSLPNSRTIDVYAEYFISSGAVSYTHLTLPTTPYV